VLVTYFIGLVDIFYDLVYILLFCLCTFFSCVETSHLVSALVILSDISMRGYLVVYDNVRDRIGWIRRNCHIRPTKTSSPVLSQVTSMFT
jgi:hypothetical protein